MTDGQQLLAEYARNGSETAFRELVSCHLDLVYSVAFRLVDGDSHRAEDVAQTVFVDLARMARTLSREVRLGGWLHRHTCFVAAHTMRGERRRQFRERRAVEMNAAHERAETDPILPLLDEAINELSEADRTAILLRFFEQCDFRSVGEAMGSNEDAARMRVNRALEKLHALLKRRGVTTSAAALVSVLTTCAVQSAPVGLVATICTAAALAETTIAAATTTTLKIVAMTTLQKTIIGAALAAAVGTGIYEAHQVARWRAQLEALQHSQTPLAEQIRILRQERDAAVKRLGLLAAKPSPHLPAPPMRATAQASVLPPDELRSTKLYARFKDNQPKLTSDQVAAYLQANGSGASSLLAAYRTSGDPALLREAMEKFPNDPQVAFEAVFDKSLPPEAQRQWLNTFEQSAPDNALPNYLSALNYFNVGQVDQGIQELTAAAGKSLDDYTLDRVQNDEEAYLSAGYSAAEAKEIGSFGIALPQLSQVRQLGQDMVDLANAYNQSGDPASARATLQMAVNLGQAYGGASAGGSTDIGQLVGMAIEGMALSAMDPNSPYGGNGQTVQDQLDQLLQQRAALKALEQQAAPLVEAMSDQDWISFVDRFKSSGGVAANQWLVSKQGQP